MSFGNGIESLQAGKGAFTVTPHDSNNFSRHAKFLYVGTGGDVVLIDLDGNVATFPNVQDGSYILCGCSRVNSTNTTASNIVGIY